MLVQTFRSLLKTPQKVMFYHRSWRISQQPTHVMVEFSTPLPKETEDLCLPPIILLVLPSNLAM